MRLHPLDQQRNIDPSSTSAILKKRLPALAAVFCSFLGVGFVYLTLRYSSHPAAHLLLDAQWDARYRVFGVYNPDITITESELDHISFQLFSRDDQRAFLEQYGLFCQEGFLKKHKGENVILERFTELPEVYATELWKYCVLYTGVANVYWQPDNMTPLHLWKDLLQDEHSHENIAVKLELVKEQEDGEKTEAKSPRLHHSFLRIVQPQSKIAAGMMRYLTDKTSSLTPIDLGETLWHYVEYYQQSHGGKNKKKHAAEPWTIHTARCIDLQEEVVQTKYADMMIFQPSKPVIKLGTPCPLAAGGSCCQVYWKDEQLPAFALRHPYITAHDDKNYSPPNPWLFRDKPASSMTDDNLGMRVEEVPYIATIRKYPTGAPPASRYETPNFFDLLFQNNCLPADKDCFKCLKTGYEGEPGGNCKQCQDACPCYCQALCKIRPPPKRLVAEWTVTRPILRRDPGRLVPKIIHQTWFEPVTKEGYPNMSRLIESFRKAGWQYEFYDDDRAAQFLSANYPPEVRQAYDAIIPGAFKADLFRYCVLLIMGGVYADMDILLESNLDKVIHPSVGFMTPQDSPGMTIGHRHCLWNGLMAVAPGHPFLARTVEVVVNNVRNRFTSVDYDDMLCPDPVLSVSHTVDTLFTAGPCVLGAALNDVLKVHRQTSFDYGDMDLFESEHQSETVTIDPTDDPRFLIPGRSVILKQNKEDMGSHRFTWEAENIVVSATDMPDYDDRPPSLEHYSKTHEKFGIYGLHKLYTNADRANEEFSLKVAA